MILGLSVHTFTVIHVLKSTEPAFVVSQLVLLAIFVVLGFGALRKFHPRAA